jgi:hypothetical protein
MDAIKKKFIKLKSREKKMLLVLFGVAILGGIIFFKPNKSVIEEVVQGDAKDVQKTEEQASGKVGKPISGFGGSGPSQKRSGGGSVSFESHNSLGNCWVVFQDRVYDITMMLDDYPGGGARLEKYCGTTKFEENFNFEQIMSSTEFIELSEDKGEYRG